MTGRYDVIVVGGGHNGLVNACYLAKAGLRTLVLEKRSVVGGAAITEELVPGFKFTTFSYALSLIRPDIVQDLDLATHGMKVLPLPHTFQVGRNGEYLVLGADTYENFHEIARHSIEDAEAYLDFNHMTERLCHAMKPLMDMIPPNNTSDHPDDLADMARLDEYLSGLDEDLKELLDVIWRGSVSEILDRYFENELLKSLLASSSIIGSKVGPRSPGSALVWLYHIIGEYDGVFGEWGFHKGGNGGFSAVLSKAAQSLGVDIRTAAEVDEVIVEEGSAVGVRLVDGEEITGSTVVSALDPRRTFMQLVDPALLPYDLRSAIGSMKFQGTAAKVNFALRGLPPFPGLEDRPGVFEGFTNIGPSIEYLETAFADCEAGRFSERPFLDVCVQSTLDPDMSPPGKHVMSCFVMYAPYHLRSEDGSIGDWDVEREQLGDTVQETLEEFFPGFGDLILHREIVTPLDIERTVGLTEGNIFAGELFAEQMFFNRPAPGWNQYRTPIEGYYQCGSGTHPGGCVIGGPGKLAATQILHDRNDQNA